MSGIVRVKRTPGDFFQAYKPTFQNEKLSFAARGLLAYLCTKPDDWEARNYDLEKASPGGKAALQTILKELRDTGYIRRFARKKENGDFDGWDTEVYERPEDNPEFSTDIPISGKTEDRKDQKSERPETGERKEIKITPNNNDINKNEGEPPEKTIKEPPPSDFELIQDAIKTACKIATNDSNKGRLYKATKEAQNTGKTPEQIEQFGEWYNTKHWPGKWPSVNQISSDWPKFEVTQNGNGSKHKEQQEPIPIYNSEGVQVGTR